MSNSYLMQYFEFNHLRNPLREVIQPFCELAHIVVSTLPSSPERTHCLRKLLEAKDCAERAASSEEND